MASNASAPPFFDLDSLPNPPDIAGNPALDPPNWTAKQWKGILVYRGYGLNFEKPKEHEKKKWEALWKKIGYYSQSPFLSHCKGPVGPGTLKADVREKYNVPNWYLTEEEALLHIRPKEIIQEEWKHVGGKQPFKVYTAMQKRIPVLSSADDEISNPQTNDQTVNDGEPQVIGLSQNVENKDGSETVQDNEDPSGASADHMQTSPPATPVVPAAAEAFEFAATQKILEVTRPVTNSDPGISSGSDIEALRSEIRESVERLLVSTAYSGLSLRSDHASGEDQGDLFANSIHDLLQIRTIAQIATSKVNISFNNSDYELDPSGMSFPYRGRGPVWKNNSCWLDSIICSARLLDAGLTQVDTGNAQTWKSSLDPIQIAFLDLLTTFWDFDNVEQNVKRRDDFLDLLAKAPEAKHLNIRSGNPGSVGEPWRVLTKNFNQFSFGTKNLKISDCCCKPPEWDPAPSIAQVIVPQYFDSDGKGVTAQELIQRWFKSKRSCPICTQESNNIMKLVTYDLPMRLVLQPDPRTSLSEHNSTNLEFNYIVSQGGDPRYVEATAYYRWMGGIYHSADKEHFRVYWNDLERGEDSSNHLLRVYDGMNASGAIIGEIEPFSKKEFIPKEWRKSAPSLVFYERILNPEIGVIDAAAATAAAMHYWTSQGMPILNEHQDWKPSPFHPSIQKGNVTKADSDAAEKKKGGSASGNSQRSEEAEQARPVGGNGGSSKRKVKGDDDEEEETSVQKRRRSK